MTWLRWLVLATSSSARFLGEFRQIRTPSLPYNNNLAWTRGMSMRSFIPVLAPCQIHQFFGINFRQAIKATPSTCSTSRIQTTEVIPCGFRLFFCTKPLKIISLRDIIGTWLIPSLPTKPRKSFLAKLLPNCQKIFSVPLAESCFIWMMQKIYKIYLLLQEIDLRNLRATRLVNTVSVLTINGEFVSNGRITKRKMLRL